MKKHLTNTLFILIILSLFISCSKDEPKEIYDLDSKFKFSIEEYKSALRSTIPAYQTANNRIQLIHSDTLIQHYKKLDYEPVFIKSFNDKSVVDSVLTWFKNADEHGLSKESYHYSQIKSAIETATRESSESQIRYNELAKVELLIADGIINYSNHLRYGVLNPKEIFVDSYFLPVPDSSSRNIFAPLEQNDLLQYISSIQLKSNKYKVLQSALQNFKSLEDREWKVIAPPAKKINIGDRDSILLLITDRLSALNFLDPSFTSANKSLVYDSALSLVVKHFQKANGLISDGVISKRTVEKLNITPKEYIQKIRVNLERLRWFDYSDSSRYVLVNIPDFKLFIVNGGEQVSDITVCTGRKRSEYVHNQLKKFKGMKRKPKVEDWETPVLYSQITHLVLNPTWTVPFSIMREEIANKVRRDSTYLKRANFRVYKNGSQISPTEVKVNELVSGSIPYTIIQNPGAGNALGKIKFMFDNPFGVYLHDTPTRAPFKYENRAVSHGCVRVEKPLELAEFLLKDNSLWNLDFLKIEIGQRSVDQLIIDEFKSKRSELRKNLSYGNTTEVRLLQSLPLFIDYYTAWVDKDGVVNFRDDVYKHDKIISEHIDK